MQTNWAIVLGRRLQIGHMARAGSYTHQAILAKRQKDTSVVCVLPMEVMAEKWSEQEAGRLGTMAHRLG
jgi:hypothetical protein